ncbi:MAG: hypothetical protein MUP82_10535 [Candidatus Marinimicrobia bacterium]|nr:hypothetical protein [Candidatus Neomarinimicrobiota bacterium]
MKKILLLLTLALIIGCSLDTFKSENLASWSLNLDVPLFKTNYTVNEMLKDYDELGVEYYPATGDSIYVFNTSTPHDVEVHDYTITIEGGVIRPEIETIEGYEQEIPTLPEELNGINFVDVDLTIEVNLSQFRVDLADSVIVDFITLTGTNDENESATATITNQNVYNNNILVVENPEELINIRSSSILIEGQISIYPIADSVDTYVRPQVIVLTSKLHAPLILEINDASTFDSNPDKVGGNMADSPFDAITLFAEIDNQMEIGGQVHFLVSPDTMNFKPNSAINPDTLFSLQLLPNQYQTNIIELGTNKFDLLADSTYMNTIIEFIGMTDGQPTHFFTGDSINVLLYGSADVSVDPQDRGGEE